MQKPLLTICKRVLLLGVLLLIACSGGSGEEALTSSPTPVNNSPVVNAGDDVGIALGESFILNGSATDNDSDDTLSYTWSLENTTVNSGNSILTEISDFGDNPGDLEMHLYVPINVSNNAPLLVAVHYCSGTGPVFYNNTKYAQLADRYGFIVVYPTANSSDKCFDVATPQALIREGNSDPASILSMVNYVKGHYNLDQTRIFATGVSSGAMMTNVLIGLYPDVFAAGAAFAGVPFTCFATNSSSTWSTACATGRIVKTAQEWGDIVRGVYPEYTGTRPRMQLWHGANDVVLNYVNFNEAIKQWTNIHGLTQEPIYTDSPKVGYSRSRYGSAGGQALVEAISLEGVDHYLPLDEAEVMRFFGLDAN